MISEVDYTAWLRDPAHTEYRTILVECHHSAGVVRLATFGYSPPTHIPFHPWLIDERLPEITYALDENTAFGAFSAVNPQETDAWRDFLWLGHECNFYHGDIRWSFDHFFKVGKSLFTGMSYDNGVYNFAVTDYGYKYDNPVQAESTGDQPTLTIYGDVFNVKPQLVDAATLTYRFNSGAGVTSLVVRDMGLDVTAHITPNYSEGTFTFNAGQNPAGAIRFDAITGGYTSAEQIVNKILSEQGLPAASTRGFTSYHNNAKLGLVVRNSVTVNQALDTLMESIGGYAVLNYVGNISLTVVDLTLTPDRIITNDDAQYDITQNKEIPPVKNLKVIYRRNWDTLSDGELATTISAADRLLYSTQKGALVADTGADTGVINDTFVYDTLLSREADAQTLLNVKSAHRRIAHPLYLMIIFDIGSTFMVGDTVDVRHHQLTAPALIVRIRKTFDDSKVHEIGLMV